MVSFYTIPYSRGKRFFKEEDIWLQARATLRWKTEFVCSFGRQATARRLLSFLTGLPYPFRAGSDAWIPGSFGRRRGKIGRSQTVISVRGCSETVVPTVRFSMKVGRITGVIFSIAIASPVSGQWLKYPTPGIPRL